jgi:MurNAc alpha-1-phosphate uridylyltransferase
MVGGQPLLVYHLHALVKAGIKEVVINTWHLGEQIIESIGWGQRFGLKIKYSIEDQLMDTGGGIVQALPLLGSDPFIVLSADILTDFPLQTLPSAPSGLAHLVMVDNPTYKSEGDFGLDRGRVQLSAAHKFTYGNIGVYRPEFFVTALQGAFPLGGLLRQHIASDLVTGQYYAGIWHNIGTAADLELANSTI